MILSLAFYLYEGFLAIMKSTVTSAPATVPQNKTLAPSSGKKKTLSQHLNNCPKYTRYKNSNNFCLATATKPLNLLYVHKYKYTIML